MHTIRGRSASALAALIAILVLVACLAAAVVALNGSRTIDGGLRISTSLPSGDLRTANQASAASFAEHVDTTFATLDAFFEDAEGGSLEQFAFDSSFAAGEEAWIAAQPQLPCLKTAAAQYAAAIESLKVASDISVRAYQSNDTVAMASLSAKIDPARPALLSTKLAVDQAAGQC